MSIRHYDQGGSTDSGSAPSSSGGTLSSLVQSVGSNPLLSALAGGVLGYMGSGGNKYGAIGGALMGPTFGSTLSSAISNASGSGNVPADSSGSGGSASGSAPSENLPSLMDKYLPLLLASYAGSFYKPPVNTPAPPPPGMASNLPTAQFNAAQTPKAPGSWYTYGQPPNYTAPGQKRGGVQHPAMPNAGALSQASRYVTGPGDGTSDDINAKLSNNEYVLSASDVSMLGNGSSDAGAAKLDAMRANLRKHKAPALAKGKLPPDAKDPEDYMDEDS